MTKITWKFQQSANQNTEVFVSEFINDVYIYMLETVNNKYWIMFRKTKVFNLKAEVS